MEFFCQSPNCVSRSFTCLIDALSKRQPRDCKSDITLQILIAHLVLSSAFEILPHNKFRIIKTTKNCGLILNKQKIGTSQQFLLFVQMFGAFLIRRAYAIFY